MCIKISLFILWHHFIFVMYKCRWFRIFLRIFCVLPIQFHVASSRRKGTGWKERVEAISCVYLTWLLIGRGHVFNRASTNSSHSDLICIVSDIFRFVISTVWRSFLALPPCFDSPRSETRWLTGPCQFEDLLLGSSPLSDSCNIFHPVM